jgi:hypothetical protein
VEDVGQQRVVRRAVDRGVEAEMAVELRGRRLVGQRLQAVERCCDGGQVLVGAPLGGARRRHRVERAPELQEIARLGGVERADPGVAVGVEVNQPVLRQAAERLAERRRAHPDGRRQRGLGKHGAGGQVAAEDQFPHPRVGVVGLGRERHGSLCSGGSRQRPGHRYTL